MLSESNPSSLSAFRLTFPRRHGIFTVDCLRVAAILLFALSMSFHANGDEGAKDKEENAEHPKVAEFNASLVVLASEFSKEIDSIEAIFEDESINLKEKLVELLKQELDEKLAAKDLEASIALNDGIKKVAQYVPARSGDAHSVDFKHPLVRSFDRHLRVLKSQADNAAVKVKSRFREDALKKKSALLDALTNDIDSAMQAKDLDRAIQLRDISAKMRDLKLEMWPEGILNAVPISEDKAEKEKEARDNAKLFAKSPFDPYQAKDFQFHWAKKLRLNPMITNSIGMKLALIPPGEFTMGIPLNQRETLGEHSGSAKPSRKVNLDQAFFMGMCEVTEYEWGLVMGANGQSSNLLLPKTNVSWVDAKDFCRKLSDLPSEKSSGRVYRLPTEAEWEYVCKCGSDGPFFWGVDNSRLMEFSWFNGNSGRRLHQVGTRSPNAWGIHDLHGNLWEWCEDWYAPYPSDGSRNRGEVPDAGTKKVQRGGSFNDSGVPAGHRNMNPPSLRHGLHGFRVVVEIPDTKR